MMITSLFQMFVLLLYNLMYNGFKMHGL